MTDTHPYTFARRFRYACIHGDESIPHFSTVYEDCELLCDLSPTLTTGMRVSRITLYLETGTLVVFVRGEEGHGETVIL